MNPGETTRPLTFSVSMPRRLLPKRSRPASSIPISIVCQRPSTNDRPPRRTIGRTGFSMEPSIRLHAGSTRPAATGIDIWRNVLRFMGESREQGHKEAQKAAECRLTKDYSGAPVPVEEFGPSTWSASWRNASSSFFRTSYRSIASRPIFWSTFAVMPAR